MHNCSLMISAVDKDLLGSDRRIDPLGLLPLWSECARFLVPHLTEQTRHIAGFQLVIEAFRLWPLYLEERPEHAQHSGLLKEFFLLVEQAFARAVAASNGPASWRLFGMNRLKARVHETPLLSIIDTSWNLLENQASNGLWGNYRGAARRADLLDDQMQALSYETTRHVTQCSGLLDRHARSKLFSLLYAALNGESVALHDVKLRNDLCKLLIDLPSKAHLYERLISAYPLTKLLATQLDTQPRLSHRLLLNTLLDAQLDALHHKHIQHVMDCENYIAVIEAVFDHLCASHGQSLAQAASSLSSLKLESLRAAQEKFYRSIPYERSSAKRRHELLAKTPALSSHLSLARSLLDLHATISEERRRSVWVRLEGEKLFSEISVDAPSPERFIVGSSWRNDYYLEPLYLINRQLNEVS